MGAHRAILMHIPYFHSMMFGGFRESSLVSEGIPVNCFSHIFQRVLQWIYTGDENIVDGSNAMELLAFAKEKGMEDLMLCTELFICENMNAENVSDVLDFAISFDFPRLKTEAVILKSTVEQPNT